MSILFIGLIVLLLIGMPIYAALGLASLAYILVKDIHPFIAVQQTFDGMTKFPLLAVPFFILAGNLMTAGNISERVFDFARSLVGWIRGGLAHVNVLASVFFSGMSGSALADAAGLGMVEIREMRRKGYDTEFAAGLTAASATIGPIIPPSISMVIYGTIANVSIGQLFVAGIVPGLLMALSLNILIVLYAVRRSYPKDQGFSLAVAWREFRRSFAAIVMPGILVGGIAAGIFTATEAAVVAAVYAGVIALFVYRSLTPRQLARVLFDTFEMTAVVMLIVGTATLFGWIIIRENVGQELTQAMLSLVSSREGVMIMLLIMLLAAGLFLETTAAILVFTPLLLPVLDAYEISRVQFGVIMVLNLMIGMMTPPVGLLLFVVSQISGLTFTRTVSACLPFMVPLLIVLMLIAAFPALTLTLPAMIYGR